MWEWKEKGVGLEWVVRDREKRVWNERGVREREKERVRSEKVRREKEGLGKGKRKKGVGLKGGVRDRW